MPSSGGCVGVQHDEWSTVVSTFRPAPTPQQEVGMLPGGDAELREPHSDAMQCFA